jgi:TetR/AcrR family transcriptional regulator, transcriptional repressor for nem operon
LHPERSVRFTMDNTKDFIIDEAFKLFLNHSYEAVSISDISKAIGFTKGALYHHFRNKEELFKSVVDKYLIMPEVEVDVNSISLAEFLDVSLRCSEKFIRGLFTSTQVFSPISYLAFFADAFRHYPGHAEQTSNFFDKEIEKTRIVVENAIASGEIRNDINPSIVAINFFSLDFGLAGNLVRRHSIDEAINLLKELSFEFYKLLKKQ